MVLVVVYFTCLFLLKQWEEGYEFTNQPQVIIKEIDGKKCEPIEETIDLPEKTFRRAVEFVTIRKGEMLSMEGKGVW
jgi:GTP-binding protein